MSDEEVNDIISCIPTIIELTSSKVDKNLNEIKDFLNLEDTELRKLVIEYPILISNFTSDIKKFEFYFKLYSDMKRDDLVKLCKSFPLLLIATVLLRL